MKILVIGGSYFLGRVFVMLAAEQHEITVVNRGSQPLTGMRLREIRGDRHDAALWQQLSEDYDVLVDFCAYREGDIRTVVGHFPGKIKQYILISTVDVYQHGKPGVRAEEDPFETVRFPGEAGDYIAGKIALERELRETCDAKGIATTVLRPALIYGPLNYAPRETMFIRLMARNGILPRVTGAEGQFRLLYVKDGAEAILRCLLREETYGQAYNLCGDEIVDYGVLADALRKAGEGILGAGAETGAGAQDSVEVPDASAALREVEISVEQAEAQGFPLPFPVSEAESLLCDNEKSRRELGMVYTSLEAGMGKTCRAFWEILG